MGPIRDEIAALEMSGIGKIAVGAMHDPEVIPLWFGESDLVTAAFIRDAAKRALDEGRTFYNYPRGILPLREALQRYHARIYGIELHPDRITVAGLDHADGGERHAVPRRPRRRGDPDRPLLAQRAQCLHDDGRRPRRRAPGRGRRPLAPRPRRGRGRDHAAHQGRLRQQPVQPHRLGDDAGAARRRCSTCAAGTGSG